MLIAPFMLNANRLLVLLVQFVAEVPMGVYKRLAVYPIVWWFLLGLFLPCRLRAMSGLSLLSLFALSAIGTVGCLVRFAAESSERASRRSWER